MNPKRIELSCNTQFVRDREIDSFTLRSVTQGGVVNFNLGFHKNNDKRK
jgi:hypothetical protein